MNKEEVHALIKKYSNDTLHYSYTATDQPAYKQLVNGGIAILPFLLGRLKDSAATNFDQDNDPWLLISLIGRISNEACLEGFSERHAGDLIELRNHVLKWGENLLSDSSATA